MKIGIMQPYFFPYIGYWQLIHAVDKFIIYDNIKYTKKSWIRRNRILIDGSDKMFTIPIKNDSDYLNIGNRYLSDDHKIECHKILKQITMAYNHAPEFDKVMPLIEDVMAFESDNLFDFIYNSIIKVAGFLEIQTELIVSSKIRMDHTLKCSDRVIETCRKLNASQYYNAIGGVTLYDKALFQREGIELSFIQTNDLSYKQFNHVFVPNLSIIDVMMFNDLTQIKALLDDYSII